MNTEERIRQFFIEAVKGNNLDVVKFLLQRVNPSADDNWAIRQSSKSGYVEMVKLLLADKRVDPSADNNFAIKIAFENGHAEIKKLLLSDERVNHPANNENIKLLEEMKEMKKAMLATNELLNFILNQISNE